MVAPTDKEAKKKIEARQKRKMAVQLSMSMSWKPWPYFNRMHVNYLVVHRMNNNNKLYCIYVWQPCSSMCI